MASRGITSRLSNQRALIAGSMVEWIQAEMMGNSGLVPIPQKGKPTRGILPLCWEGS